MIPYTLFCSSDLIFVPINMKEPPFPFSTPAFMASLQGPCDPPFQERFSSLFSPATTIQLSLKNDEQCELPLIDLWRLECGDEEGRKACIAEIGKASSEWGFFQVVNHGINTQLLQAIKEEQRRLFHSPFEKKVKSKVFNESYRWGNPTATSLDQFSWSEAFHVPLSKLGEDDGCFEEEFKTLRVVMQKVAEAMTELARILAGVLAENLGCPATCFLENCSESTCFLRLNRYPPCPFFPAAFGLMPHTDSDFLTILHQDQVGGLQLMKDSKWVSVKPNPDALIVNIGDLFQAWSNDVYKSVEHKVMANGKVERYSMAYFLCPSYESIIGSCKEPSRYKKFTFEEFRRQVQEDVKRTGYKVGLARFLI
ncbi:Gibberellin 2-beta-dioxygenase 8 [Dendrobium catenatum]|uniref:gibberellin 2beta-dioxygenase n=1 Tax=Dendrobium catenatum TaxID=906689 RepID=A0A2I0WJQ5_9ASPA|nr:Gibberellin 2-beta-dioxygenase 8 [Dendrobium catenatum]